MRWLLIAGAAVVGYLILKAGGSTSKPPSLGDGGGPAGNGTLPSVWSGLSPAAKTYVLQKDTPFGSKAIPRDASGRPIVLPTAALPSGTVFAPQTQGHAAPAGGRHPAPVAPPPPPPSTTVGQRPVAPPPPPPPNLSGNQ